MIVYLETDQKSLLFDEYEIVTEPEPTEEKSKDDEAEKYKTYLEKKRGPQNVDAKLDADLQKIDENSDEMFLKFKECIDREPEQVHMLVYSIKEWWCNMFLMTTFCL